MTRKVDDILRLGETNHRGHRQIFGIRRADRRSHVYVIGKTGTGKSTLVATLVRQDLRRGDGCALVDPHGDLFREIEGRIPAERSEDVIHFDVTAPDLAFGFNPLAAVPVARRTLAASAFLDVFRRQWDDSWGPRLEHILRNAILTLLDQPSATLADILPLLGVKEFRRKCLSQVENPQVRQFWLEEYEKYPYNLRAQAIAPVQNKVGAFLANPILCRVLTHEQPIDLRQIMDERKVLLVNLAKGYVGGDGAALLGGLLTASIGWTAFGRADRTENERPDFFVYLDEFHSYATLALTTLLSELRKYGLGFLLAHQYLGQLDREIQDAIFGNVGTIISFRVGYRDSEVIAKELFPVFEPGDLINLPNYSFYVKLMIDGVSSKPFSARTLGPRQVGVEDHDRAAPASDWRHLAHAIGRAAIHRGYAVLYRGTHALLEEIAEATVESRRSQYMADVASVDLLIIDDLGMRKLPATAAENLLDLVMRRYERASTMITSNRPVDDWGKLLGDTTAVTALLDRLLHHGHVLKCGPRSWRLKKGENSNTDQQLG